MFINHVLFSCDYFHILESCILVWICGKRIKLLTISTQPIIFLHATSATHINHVREPCCSSGNIVFATDDVVNKKHFKNGASPPFHLRMRTDLVLEMYIFKYNDDGKSRNVLVLTIFFP
jgi:hypothetical protein